MPAPLLLIGLGLVGAAALAAGSKKKSSGARGVMTDTIRALAAEDAERIQKCALAFENMKESTTAAALRNVARRVADSNSGAVVAPALSLDPDNKGDHACGEWAAIVAQAENRPTALRDWSDAFGAEGYPAIANVIRQKADALEAGLAAPPLVLSPQQPTTTAPITPGSETGGLDNDGTLNVDDDGASEPAEPGVNVPGRGGGSPAWTQVPDPENLPDAYTDGSYTRVPMNDDGSMPMKDGSTLNADGSRVDASGVTTYPDGTKQYPTGQTKLPDGTILPSTKTTTTAPKPAGFDVQKAVADALASGSATTLAAAAAQLETLGYKEQASQLKERAAEILAASKPHVTAPSPTAPIAPPVVQVVTRTYLVKAGDNPTKIAQLFTGNGNRWKELVKANPKKAVDPKTGNFKQLSAGESLTLPTSWPSTPPAAVTAPVKTAPPIVVAKPPVVVAPPTVTPRAPAPQPSTPSAPVVTNVLTYIVAPGDSAWAIASKLTGDGNRWRELTKANPGKKTGADGNFVTLNAGEKLILPAGWAVSADQKYDTALRMTANLQKAASGKEDQALVKAFQSQEGAAAVGSADGKYGPKSGLRVAYYGIVPAKPRYWSSATKAKDAANYKAAMGEYAKRDPSRSAQWLEAGKV